MASSDQSSRQFALDVPRVRARSALEEPCVKCGAPKGEPCRTANGERVSYEHKARRRLAQFLPIGGR